MNFEVLIKKTTLSQNHILFNTNILRLKQYETLHIHEIDKQSTEYKSMQGFIDQRNFHVYETIFNF